MKTITHKTNKSFFPCIKLETELSIYAKFHWIQFSRNKKKKSG